VLVIGGGATGCGIALDAATRGLSVCLVERDDFASGSSSRSTKLIHGGVRYLEAAFKDFDYHQAALVFEALRERALFLRIAPHLTQPLPIMTPCYSYFDCVYYWAGLKVYDLFARVGATKDFGWKALVPRHTAGLTGLYSSYFVSPEEALRQFPTLARTGEACTLEGSALLQ
jgi:glycerol-3-phosphate dehydrogenase